MNESSFDETERSDLSLCESSKSNRSNSKNNSKKNDSRTQGSKKRKLLKLEDNPRAIYYLPRIPRNDVRRQYAMMFSNVYNSHDWDFMSKFVQTFFQPTVLILFQKYCKLLLLFPLLLLTYILPIADKSKYNEVECKGSENILQVWYDAIADSPDLIFKPEKGQIKVRTDGTAVISSTFLVQGTIIDDMILPKSAIFEEIDKQLGPDLFQDAGRRSTGFSSRNNQTPSDNLSIQNSLNTTSSSDFDKEFEIALSEYLNEDSTHCFVEEDEVELQRFNPSPSSSSLMSDMKVFQCLGHFSLHLTAESIIHFCVYSIFSSKTIS